MMPHPNDERRSTTLIFPADAEIAVINRRGIATEDEFPLWLESRDWHRLPDGRIEARYLRDNEGFDELELCMAACSPPTSGGSK